MEEQRFTVEELREKAKEDHLISIGEDEYFRVFNFTMPSGGLKELTPKIIKQHAMNGWALYLDGELYEVYSMQQSKEYKFKISGLERYAGELQNQIKSLIKTSSHDKRVAFISGVITAGLGFVLSNLLFG